MKFTYFCLIALLVSCSDPQEKKNTNNDNNNNNENNGQILDMGTSDTTVTNDVGTTEDVTIRPDTGTGDDMTPDVQTENKPPTIRDFRISPLEITEGESFTFEVEVRDPDGEDDIERGTLRDSEQNRYGSFVNEGGGFYLATLSWNEIHAVSPISFSRSSLIEFLAVFEDSAGNTIEENLTGKLVCSGDERACEGTCVDVQSDPNYCGRCTTSCSASEQCVAGTCETPSENENYVALCANSNDCTDGNCVTINSVVFNGDVCSKLCNDDQDCRGNSTCLDLTIVGLGKFCANRCDAQNPCDNGLNCVDVPNNALDVCLPS